MKKVIIFHFLIAVLLLNPILLSANDVDAKNKKKRPKVGLVLSGGGAKGFAYVGLLDLLQEVNMPIDYIGGTSIGSIMGGLFAAGYDADAIKEIITNQDWNALLRDEIPRKYISYDEKEYMGKSILSFPIKRRKVNLMQSMYHGQQINLLLNRYFSPVWDVRDFSELQTPFLCVAANLFNGDAEVLTGGYLPYAVRSSMSIPGYFSPTLYNGKYLIDGGVVNNYPAGPIKKEGTDLLLGGDVQSGLKDTITQLQTLTEIINQIVFFHAEEANTEADSLIKINVKLKVPAGMMDFDKYDTIIKYGYAVAELYREEITALADSLNALEPSEPKVRNTKPLVFIDIVDVYYEGNDKMPDDYLDNYFDNFKNSTVTIHEIENIITRLYGTRFFEYVFYELQPSSDGKANLLIRLKESSPGYLGASVHYDLDYHGSVLVNGTFRNIFGNRSKLFAELIMGTNPRFRALYLLSNGPKPGFGVDLDMYDFKFSYYDKATKITDIKMANIRASVFYTSIFRNLYSFRAGFEYEYFRFKQAIVVSPEFVPFENFKSYGNVFFSFRADTRNKEYYATNGFESELVVRYCMTLSDGWVDSVFTNSLVVSGKFDYNAPLSGKLTLKPAIFAGFTLQQDEPPIQHWFGAGGLNEINYISNFVPFTGVKFVQKLGLYSAIGRMKLQYNIFKKLYFTLRADVGAVEETTKELFNVKNTMVGYGATASYDSFIGPVEFTVMASNINPGISFFVNVGFSF